MVKKEEPQVTIIMATYNRSHLIGESLEAIINQTFNDWECLVIDDGSNDDTEKVVADFMLRDTQIKYYKRPLKYKKGLPGCRNYGLDLAKGEYVIYFDDDDIAHPDNLKICVAELKNENISYCRYLKDVFRGEFDLEFDRGGEFSKKLLESKDLEEIVMGVIPFNSCQVMWRRECFHNNYFDEDLMYAEEWECYTRILCKGVKGLSVNKVLFYGRKHAKSNTGEFWTNDSIRRNSYVKAVKLVIDHLKKNDRLSESLKQYFIRMGFFFKEYSIIAHAMEATNAPKLERIKYNLGFRFYPAVKEYFHLADKVKKRRG